MTIHARPTPLRPTITSVAELDAYLARRLDDLHADCYDEETRQSIGVHRRLTSTGAYSALTDLRGLIAGWVLEEAEALAADAEYDRWKETYGADAPNLAVYQAEGR